MNKRGFASDNFSGVLPEVLEAINEANQGHVMAYGGDHYTASAIEKFKQLFGENIDVYFAFNGTGANVIGLSVLTQSYHSILCPATAHIQVDECGAPDKFTGCKVIPIDTPNGKLTPELIKPQLHGFGFEHHSQPKVLQLLNAPSWELFTPLKRLKPFAIWPTSMICMYIWMVLAWQMPL